jgi:hypothetical protein
MLSAALHSREIGGNNGSRYAEPEFDALLELGAATEDGPERAAAYRAAQLRAMADLPLLPLYHHVGTYAKRSELTGERVVASSFQLDLRGARLAPTEGAGAPPADAGGAARALHARLPARTPGRRRRRDRPADGDRARPRGRDPATRSSPCWDRRCGSPARGAARACAPRPASTGRGRGRPPTYLGGRLRGDLGTSRRSGRPVSAELRDRLPATVALAAAALPLALALGLATGVATAAFARSWLDTLLTGALLVGRRCPPTGRACCSCWRSRSRSAGCRRRAAAAHATCCCRR